MVADRVRCWHRRARNRRRWAGCHLRALRRLPSRDSLYLRHRRIREARGVNHRSLRARTLLPVMAGRAMCPTMSRTRCSEGYEVVLGERGGVLGDEWEGIRACRRACRRGRGSASPTVRYRPWSGRGRRRSRISKLLLGLYKYTISNTFAPNYYFTMCIPFAKGPYNRKGGECETAR